MADDTLNAEESPSQPQGSQTRLTPINFSDYDYIPGKYAPWYCSPEPCFGPDELGEYANAIDDLIKNVNRCDSAARIWEVLQAWEMRLFRRNYHFLTAGWKGWGIFGGSAGTTGQSIMQTGNSLKLFSCNVFGARHKKIVALLSREVPGCQVVAEDDDDPMDQAAAEAGNDYAKVFEHQSDLKSAMEDAASYFYTDGRAGWLTYTIADQGRWGTELADRQQEVYGEPKEDGVSPETEAAPVSQTEVPVRREVTRVFGKLETKVPLMSDHEYDMPWKRFQWEESVNRLRAQYPWVRKKIATQGNIGGMDQIDRMARINVRLAVQASSSSGEAYKNDATHTVTFLEANNYESIEDEAMRKVFYDEFPDGLEVWHAGGQLALVRNCRSSRHTKIIHATAGDGQNREAIGTNYLPLQKILNAEISLVDRYFRSAIPRRYAMEPYIDTQQMNSQINDPGKVTAVATLENKGLRIQDITGIDNVPSPNTAMLDFIQWLIQGAPEAMDGGAPAVFGLETSTQEKGTYGEAKLDRDQALQVFSMPWRALCDAICTVTFQAIESAAENRNSDISASLPGQTKLVIELEKLQGSVLVHPESLEIPQTLAEQEQQMAELLEQSANVALYQQIMLDPENLSVFSKFPSLSQLKIPGADQVEAQQGEFEILMKSGPVPNPQLQMLQQQMEQGQAEITQMAMQAENDPTGQGQQIVEQHLQAMQQLQQAAQSLPPLVSTVPVAQDTSENHMIHAAITLGMLTSPTGRKLKNGNDEQKAVFQNIKLHWTEHMAMLKQLQPPKEIEFKGSLTVDPSKYPPEVQSEVFQAAGLQMPPAFFEAQEQTHEIVQEKEGVDSEGVPVKTKVSMVGKPLQ